MRTVRRWSGRWWSRRCAGGAQILGCCRSRRPVRRVASMFEETVSFFIKQDGWEQWRFLNLSGILHPMHIHLVTFQPLERETVSKNTFKAFRNALGEVVGGGTDGAVEIVKFDSTT